MMKVEQIKTPDDIERYIEGCLNDFETAISTKDETLVFLAELVVHVYKEAKKEQCNIADVNHRLLRELRQMYLVNVDGGGQPKASIAEIMDLWDRVNRELQIVTID